MPWTTVSQHLSAARAPDTRAGSPLLFPVWVAAIFAAAWLAWLRVLGPMPWWYAGTLIGGLLIAGITVSSVLATIRQPAFRADRNGIRLGLRTERKRPRNRQAHLWWSDVRQLRIEPRRYGLMVEISLGPAARIVRRRGPVRQVLLWCDDADHAVRPRARYAPADGAAPQGPAVPGPPV